MKNTVEMILGEQEALKAFDAYTTPECNVHDTLEAMLRQADGTPFLGEIAVDGETILTVRFTAFGFCDTIADNS